ncbi:NAD(P)H-dependent oxidoreductase [Malaciobacter marinus]|uniref:Flavodoxin n=1 Tax=Malaciobacter marinus TaxID=505249 RepID=A0A347TK61_9BACT|nr:NAD(P)H-dependent oxidoreductase [Malaciobacter marinus]AXX86989.1 flavodoxin-like fold domain-containing protein, putative NAD(P)H (quinone) dehydrogenase/reductase [Malaciobacter marinus]PHO13140.1 flavodoxin [Malaciobacter marinus]PHO14250.1 flavodoxin [Malaciobacter marinus]
MKNVLIINGHQKYEEIAEGKLTQTFINKAQSFFENNNFEVKHSIVESDYNIKEELEKFKWADYILFQYPVYWMGVPWLTKKYMDEMFSGGNKTVTFINDGRSRSDSSKKYGSGGLMTDKKYMLSLTYNCPSSEFSNKDGFFDGLSLDEANIAVHKTFQFCGAKPLETYAIHDIFKTDLDINSELKKFEDILIKNFL